MKRIVIMAALAAVALTAVAGAQGRRQPSPDGSSATEIRGKFTTGDEPQYQNGKWIEITYSRPIKRGRDLWGSGANYGKMLNNGAPVWRAGANVSTRIKTELPLEIGGKTVNPGEYSLFVDLKPNDWTLIVSSWPAQKDYDPSNKNALYGSFEYTPDKDVTRAKMALTTLPMSIDQLTWNFADMSDAGGKITLMWDKTLAAVPFTVK